MSCVKSHIPSFLQLVGRRHGSCQHTAGHNSFIPHPLLHQEWVVTVCFETSIKQLSKSRVSHMPSRREGEGKKYLLPAHVVSSSWTIFSSVTSEQLWHHLETAENEQFWPKDFICSRNYSQMCPDCQKGSLCRPISHISSWTKIICHIKKDKEKRRKWRKKKRRSPRECGALEEGMLLPFSLISANYKKESTNYQTGSAKERVVRIGGSHESWRDVMAWRDGTRQGTNDAGGITQDGVSRVRGYLPSHWATHYPSPKDFFVYFRQHKPHIWDICGSLVRNS